MEFGLIILGVVAVFVIWFVMMYNKFVGLRTAIENSWAQIDVQLKRRADMIPNLVETVRGYASHEKETLERVIQARNMAVSATSVGEQVQAENMLSGALKSLFAVSEAYPDLKANTNFLALQEELTSTENKVAFARQHYNDQAMDYNTYREKFPSNIVAGMFSFTARPYFEVTDEADRVVPKVKFN